MASVESVAKEAVMLARTIYGSDPVPLHRPLFEAKEREYLIDCIDSNFVSSVGAKVGEFEQQVAAFVGSKHAIATMNGTAALHIALLLAGVVPGDEVISQALTFVATCNSISYAGASPVFVDVDIDTMGLSPSALRKFLEKSAIRKADGAFNKLSGRRISACVPMHTFGFPCRIVEIAEICAEWGIALVEDAAESLGSYVNSKHTGTFSSMATLSFNGNKVITTGAGGMILTDDPELSARAKHVTTTAKVPHRYEFLHDEVGFNYRLPNLNAALGCAQMECLEQILVKKREIAVQWRQFFVDRETVFLEGIDGVRANHWLNTIVLDSRKSRDLFLRITNDSDVMTRPIWTLMSKLPMFKDSQTDGLEISCYLEDRVVNIPSSVPSGSISNAFA